MGVDLTLCPGSPRAESNSWFLAYDRLRVGVQDYGMFERIQNSAKPIPENWRFDWYGDEGLETVTTDRYGKPLTYMPAGELAKRLVATEHPGYMAVRAYVAALPPDCPIVLWWH